MRKQNGAYGIYTIINRWIETLSFVSYRDPLLTLTLMAYDEAADSLYKDLREGVISVESVTTAIVGAIGLISGSDPDPTVGFWNFSEWLTGRGVT